MRRAASTYAGWATAMPEKGMERKRNLMEGRVIIVMVLDRGIAVGTS